eukprot:5186936-Pyramimonas_sp.AAC.1
MKVLVVEDNPVSQKLMKLMLECEGWEVRDDSSYIIVGSRRSLSCLRRAAGFTNPDATRDAFLGESPTKPTR